MDFWKQRAKSRWDSFGDQSTSFFFKSIKSRSSHNTIKAIKDPSGNWLSNHQDINNLFLTSFKELFCLNQSHQVTILPTDPFLNTLTPLKEYQIRYISSPFTEKEIK